MKEFVRKTFVDTYGQHALVHTDGQPGQSAGRIDVNWLIPRPQEGRTFHPTRYYVDYQPKHAK
jgi:hypothetical protein